MVKTGLPPDIHLDDLAQPRFPPAFRAALAGVQDAARGLPWCVDGLLEQAARETGLDDFGADLFSEPLGVLLESLEREAGLSALGRLTAWSTLLQFMKSRLLIEDQCRREPAIMSLPVERPIIIAGLPRSGTTHLHNLIAADPALRHLPWWEALEPVPPRDEQEAPRITPDPRIARAASGIAQRDAVMPAFKRMHDMWPEHAHEEIHLLGVAGSTLFFETLGGPAPSWRDYYLASDQTPWYRYLRKILQVLQFLRGGKRWVLKSPQHLEQFGPLLRVFPDAVCVVTHRDPVSITASMATMLAYAARLARDPVRPEEIGRYWADRGERLLRSCSAAREHLPAKQSLDLHFDAFMRDDIAAVRRVYALAGQPFDKSVEARMRAFMAEHPRGKHGRVRYELSDLGLDRATLRRRLAFYVERFGVALEETG